MLKGDVLLVSGSLRRASYNTALLREAAKALPSGVGHLWLHGIPGLPPYSEDDDGEQAPAAVERLRRTIAAAGAVLIATPEYNGSIPGGLKNAVDWASRPFPDSAWRDKPVAVIGASTGLFGAVWAQAQLRKALGIAGARVIAAELAVAGAHEVFLSSGALRDPALATGLRDVVAALAGAQLAPAVSSRAGATRRSSASGSKGRANRKPWPAGQPSPISRSR
jgi:chromate reductase, NAD(P)H dehydrogenase (quinone)